ncbi:hypothetical protein M0813_00432 [Anaeramoeba flamelloides]|uniref:Uncharacterized protein n=1 Tax=Anaeramoeba flamelloides TaxID=1746091 RepID=A0ABQ8YAV3_9EUKA|nr:hypothetical protein M0813_00432 [Anaeramoeba flamelloides]
MSQDTLSKCIYEILLNGSEGLLLKQLYEFQKFETDKPKVKLFSKLINCNIEFYEKRKKSDRKIMKKEELINLDPLKMENQIILVSSEIERQKFLWTNDVNLFWLSSFLF